MARVVQSLALVVSVVSVVLPTRAVCGDGGVSNGMPTSRTIDGYRGIWFDLGQRSEFGSKYSGGLGTYTAKHIPLAVHVPEARKTFFVYGGTTSADERHLLAMASYYDHERDVVPRPTVVHDKGGVDDPHDNPSIAVDGDGHVWVFVSGRGRSRPGFTYRSTSRHSVASFERIAEAEFTYPQTWWIDGKGFLFLFTKYTRGRELYWATSPDGRAWSEHRKLAGMGGHYQVSAESHGRVITAFSMHPGGNVDRRTNLYYVESADFGESWRTASGAVRELPLTDARNPTLVRDYRREKRLVYLKDITFDADGRPVILYVTSRHHAPGPRADPRVWTVARWDGEGWVFHEVTSASHNYDMGSLYVEGDSVWRLIAPTEIGPQRYGTGGRMAMWTSGDAGKTWRMVGDLTEAPRFNHGYARRPHGVNGAGAHPDFYAFWADGDPDTQSESRLYFTDRSGTRTRVLPYTMDGNFATPRIRKTPSTTSER